MTTHKDSGGEGVAIRFSKTLCFDFMDEALQAPVRLECGPDVERIRRRFYRARQWCQARGDYRYDGLKFQIAGSALVISKRPARGGR